MKRKMFLAVALFAALISIASAQTPLMGGDPSLNSKSYSFINRSSDVHGIVLFTAPATPAYSDYLVTVYIDAGPSTAAGGTICPQLNWNDSFSFQTFVPAAASGSSACTVTGGTDVQSIPAYGTTTLHVQANTGVQVRTTSSYGVGADFDLIVTATQLNP
jgi:hypothetical protein